MKRIKLTAHRWHQKVEDGYIHRRAGDVIEVPDKDADRLIRVGAAVASRAKLTDPDEATADAAASLAEDKASAAKAIPHFVEIEDGNVIDDAVADGVSDEAEDTTDGEPDIEPSDVDKPKATDSTDVWRAYAIAQGMDEDEANNLNRTELRKHYS